MAKAQHDGGGKRCLVTGGARGIGAAIAERLAAGGAAVAITYSKSGDAAEALVRKITSAGGKAVAFKADGSDPKTAAGAAAQAVEKLGGKLDVLVNNAGLYESGGTGAEGDIQFEKQLNVNVRGVWYTTTGALSLMNDGGRIINIGSVVSERVPFGGITAYAMTKHAVAGLTKGWARELAGRRITVNNVQPGMIDTDMNPNHPDNPAAGMVDQLIPLKRYGGATEVAGLVAYLASDEAAYVTGASFTIDGGLLA